MKKRTLQDNCFLNVDLFKSNKEFKMSGYCQHQNELNIYQSFFIFFTSKDEGRIAIP